MWYEHLNDDHRRAVSRCDKDALRQILADEGLDAHDAIGWPLIIIAADAGSVEVVRYLLNVGVDPNVVEATGGQSALTLSALKGYDEIVDVLLQNGANPNATTGQKLFGSDGDCVDVTPMLLIAESDNLQMVKLLAKNGGRVSDQQLRRLKHRISALTYEFLLAVNSRDELLSLEFRKTDDFR